MGLFKNIKSQVQAVSNMAAEIKAAMPAVNGAAMSSGVGAAPPDTAIINPSPQHEVDRLWDAAGIARGVLIGSYDDISDGDRPIKTRVHTRVRARLRGGGLGPEKKLIVWVGWKVAVLLEPGLEIPIELDRATGEATSIAAKDLTNELSPRFDEAKKKHRAATLDFDLDGLTQLPAVLREAFQGGTPEPPAGLAADHPLMAPVNGVTWEQYIAVRAHAHVNSVTQGIDAIARQYGVEAGRWDAAYAGWTQRVMAAPPLAAQFGWDLDKAQKDLRR